MKLDKGMRTEDVSCGYKDIGDIDGNASWVGNGWWRVVRTLRHGWKWAGLRGNSRTVACFLSDVTHHDGECYVGQCCEGASS